MEGGAYPLRPFNAEISATTYHTQDGVGVTGGFVQNVTQLTPRSLAEFILESGSKEIEREVDDTTREMDPYQRKPSFSLPKQSIVLIVIIPIMCWLLLFISLGFDIATRSFSKESYGVEDMLVTIFTPDVDAGRSVVEASLNTMSLVFGLLITVIIMMLELSAERFTGHVITLFFKDPIIGISLSYVAFSNAFCYWVYMSIGRDYVPNTSVVLSLLMVISHLVLLFPFLSYLFFFLEPDKVVNEIMESGLRAAEATVNAHGKSHEIAKLTLKATLAVEQLMDAAGRAIRKKDRNITAEIVDALCSFSIRYGLQKNRVYPTWFEIPRWLRQTPDFLSLSEDAVRELEEKKTWLEWKILRGYQTLFGEALKFLKESCYHIAMNARLIGESAASRGDLPSLDLVIKFFNTFLRASMNAQDQKTIYNVLFQYRQLAECTIKYGHEIAESGATQENELEQRALQIAKYMKYYSFQCYKVKLNFLVEVVYHDVRVLCDYAFRIGSVIHDKLFQIFLKEDDASDGKQESTQDGVRRAQISLALSYLSYGNQHYPRRIHDEMLNEDHKRLWNIMNNLLNITNREFWEVSERGTNFEYVTPAQKGFISTFFSWFPGFHHEQIELSLPERRKLQRKQVLFDFD